MYNILKININNINLNNTLSLSNIINDNINYIINNDDISNIFDSNNNAINPKQNILSIYNYNNKNIVNNVYNNIDNINGIISAISKTDNKNYTNIEQLKLIPRYNNLLYSQFLNAQNQNYNSTLIFILNNKLYFYSTNKNTKTPYYISIYDSNIRLVALKTINEYIYNKIKLINDNYMISYSNTLGLFKYNINDSENPITIRQRVKSGEYLLPDGDYSISKSYLLILYDDSNNSTIVKYDTSNTIIKTINFRNAYNNYNMNSNSFYGHDKNSSIFNDKLNKVVGYDSFAKLVIYTFNSTYTSLLSKNELNMIIDSNSIRVSGNSKYNVYCTKNANTVAIVDGNKLKTIIIKKDDITYKELTIQLPWENVTIFNIDQLLVTSFDTNKFIISMIYVDHINYSRHTKPYKYYSCIYTIDDNLNISKIWDQEFNYFFRYTYGISIIHDILYNSYGIDNIDKFIFSTNMVFYNPLVNSDKYYIERN